MTNQYSDLFTYETLEFDGANVSYANVTLLKKISTKKAGAKLDEIRLNTRTGKFTVPRSKTTRIEFQGNHTRFTD
jgi:hypothetical protein